MNIFVLGTGRCGSKTFAKACAHLPGWTSGHETRAHLQGPERLAYPEQHIEVDNRLCWFLGQLGERYDSRDTLYVHLVRDAAATAASLCAWSLPTPDRPHANPASILRAFAHGLTLRTTQHDRAGYEQAARAYVDSVQANIREFQRHRPKQSMSVVMGHEGSFGRFLDRIGAEGDCRSAALAEWAVRHNARAAA